MVSLAQSIVGYYPHKIPWNTAKIGSECRGFRSLRMPRIQADLLPGYDRIDDASAEYMLSMDEIARETVARYTKLLDRLVDVLAPDPLQKLELDVA